MSGRTPPGPRASLPRRVARLVDTAAIAIGVLDALAFLLGHGMAGTGPIEVLTALLVAVLVLLVHWWLGAVTPGLERYEREEATSQAYQPPFPSPASRAPAADEATKAAGRPSPVLRIERSERVRAGPPNPAVRRRRRRTRSRP